MFSSSLNQNYSPHHLKGMLALSMEGVDDSLLEMACTSLHAMMGLSCFQCLAAVPIKKPVITL